MQDPPHFGGDAGEGRVGGARVRGRGREKTRRRSLSRRLGEGREQNLTVSASRASYLCGIHAEPFIEASSKKAVFDFFRTKEFLARL